VGHHRHARQPALPLIALVATRGMSSASNHRSRSGNLIMSNALMIVGAATLGTLGTEPPKGQSDRSRRSEMDGKYATPRVRK